MRLYRYLLVSVTCLVVVYFVLSKRSNESSNTSGNHEFFFGAIGEQFEHDPRISVTQNPHGESDRAFFTFAGHHIGAMFVSAPPPSGARDFLTEVIIERTKKDFGATSVSHRTLTNRNGLSFDHFSSDAHNGGMTYRYELYLHEAQPLTPSISDTYLRQMLGMHKFEFIVPIKEAPDVLPLINEVIDTFKLRAK